MIKNIVIKERLETCLCIEDHNLITRYLKSLLFSLRVKLFVLNLKTENLKKKRLYDKAASSKYHKPLIQSFINLLIHHRYCRMNEIIIQSSMEEVQNETKSNLGFVYGLKLNRSLSLQDNVRFHVKQRYRWKIKFNRLNQIFNLWKTKAKINGSGKIPHALNVVSAYVTKRMKAIASQSNLQSSLNT